MTRYEVHASSGLYLPRICYVAGRCGLVCLRSLLAVQTGTTLHICQRGVLQRRTCGSLAAAQLSSHEVAVESLSGAATIKIKANLQIRGCRPSAVISLWCLVCKKLCLHELCLLHTLSKKYVSDQCAVEL